MMNQVMTLTVSPTIDTSTEVDHVVPERKLRCEQPRTDPGGGGVNVARVLSRFGVDTLALFTAGGHTGELLVELVEAEGVAVQAIPISGQTRENVTVRETATTLQYRFCMPGPTILASEWRGIVHAIETVTPAPAYLVASGSLSPGLPDDAYAEIARIAKERGIHLILDTSGKPLKAALEAGVYLVKPNLSELASLVEESWIEDEDHLRSAANSLVSEHDAEAVVVSLGAGGAYAVTPEGRLRIPAPAIYPESKVGAGDSMVAGITWGLARGWTMLEAASLGVAAGAAAVMTPGSELCRRGDTERLYAQLAEQFDVINALP